MLGKIWGTLMIIIFIFGLAAFDSSPLAAIVMILVGLGFSYMAATEGEWKDEVFGRDDDINRLIKRERKSRRTKKN